MAYKPSNQLPVTGPTNPNSPYPNQLQQPIQVRRTIDASKNWLDQNQNADAVGDSIVDYYSATIGNFVNAQRRDYSAGIVEQHSKFLNMPGLTIQYENRQGQERLSLTAYPESFTGGGLVNEFNYDGYFAVMSLATGDASVVTYQAFLNGSIIGTWSAPANLLGTVLFRFGPTALRCQSLIDKPQGGPGNPNDAALGPVRPVLPPRPKVKAFANNLTVKISEHPDLPLYAVYQRDNILNTAGIPSTPPTPPIFKTFVFPDIGKTPLLKTGFNRFRLKPQAAFTESQSASLFLYAEFYNRNSLRNVFQSWSRQASDGQSLTVNDQPNYWHTGGSLIPVLALDVDLTQKIDTTKVTPFPWAFNPSGGDVGNPANPPYDRGYWRIGDGSGSLTAPPSDPWSFASGAWSQALSLWNSAKTGILTQYNDVPINAPLFDPFHTNIPLVTANAATAASTETSANIYSADGAALTSFDAAVASMLLLLNTYVGPLPYFPGFDVPPGPNVDVPAPGTGSSLWQTYYTYDIHATSAEQAVNLVFIDIASGASVYTEYLTTQRLALTTLLAQMSSYVEP